MSESTKIHTGTMQINTEQQIMDNLSGKGYRYIANIGNGSFSEVYRVWDAQRKCFLACKVSEHSELAEGEAKLLQQLQNPLFPQYKDSWKCGEKHYLLMEDITGRNVRELLWYRGHFSQRQAVRIALALAQGLMYLHERSEPIVFRDIKPENIMVRQDGIVKLVDVGCACRKGKMGNIAGSRAYGAPEQFQGKEGVGEESDVYALGKLLFLMLTGGGIHKRIAPGLLQLIKQATAQERHERIPDMRTFMKRLIVYLGNPSLKRFFIDAKAYLSGGVVADFYYIQNVRKGMDDYG